MAKKSQHRPNATTTPTTDGHDTASTAAPENVQTHPTPSDDSDPVLRQNAPIHCPYCKQPCEPKSDALFTTYRCVNKECGITYSNKVPRPRLSQRLGRKAGDDEHSAR